MSANSNHKIDTPFTILQITDLHLSSGATNTTDATPLTDCQQRFEAVLQQALNQDIDCDLILVTGDLVSKVDPAIYDYIYSTLQATGIDFACIAGNHDVTDEVGSELPFAQRQLVAHIPDPRLLSQHVIETECWQLLLINSAISGKVAGEISADDIGWLYERLSRCDKPALLALHHHLIPMNSGWIDAYSVQNSAIFWQRMSTFSHLRVIINGHTHQEKVNHHNGVTIYTTPSTCYQYQPFKDDFAFDTTAHSGYRWLQLGNNGQVASWVERVDN